MTPVSDPRERRINELFLRGHATSKELFEADFGEWPPKGLSIQENNPKLTIRINLKSFWEDDRKTKAEKESKVRQSLGYISTSLSTIFLHPRYIDPLRDPTQNIVTEERHTTLGHEHAHILQNVFGHRTLLQDITTYFLLRNESPFTPRGLFKRAKNILTKPRHNTTDKLEYFKEGIEIQARLYEVLIDGYPRWKEMPSSREELWAALANGGVELPKPILKTLKNSTEGQKALQKFGPSASSAILAPNGLNKVLASLSSDTARENCWKNLFPLIYASLLEMCGDSSGKVKMGLEGKTFSAKPALKVYIRSEKGLRNTLRSIEKHPTSLQKNFRGIYQELTPLTKDLNNLRNCSLRREFDESLEFIASCLNDNVPFFLESPDEGVQQACDTMRENLKDYPPEETKKLLQHINVLEKNASAYVLQNYEREIRAPSRSERMTTALKNRFRPSKGLDR